MNVAHLLASPFYGGPERQAVGLCSHLPGEIKTSFFSYAEGGKATMFLTKAKEAGFPAFSLRQNWPHVLQCCRELVSVLREHQIDVLCTHGYKPDILGVIAGRAAGIPTISFAHGWTSATWKVRANEWMDKRSMRWFDRVIGVSEKQSDRVRRSGVAKERVVTIHNAIALSDLKPRTDADRVVLESLFSFKPSVIAVAAGRLSPEKGFDVLIDAAKEIVHGSPDTGIVIFGAGPLDSSLQKQIFDHSLQRNVILGGFRTDLDRILPQADVFVLSSRTEGLPVIMLEAMGSGVAVCATPVGGVPEVIDDEVEGLIAITDNVSSLAKQILRLLTDVNLRQRLSAAAKKRVALQFTHDLQAHAFVKLLHDVQLPPPRK